MDSQLMKKKISKFFGADVQYKVPMGSNILRMPKALVEHICSPADIQVLRARDTAAFLKQVNDWSLGESDSIAMSRLFSLIEDELGFHVFELMERAKRELSEASSTEFKFRYPHIDFNCEISAAEFQSFVTPTSEEILQVMLSTVERGCGSSEEIDLVLCTGGTAKLSTIRMGLEQHFPKEKILNYDNFHAVIRGLGFRAREIYFS